jgi:hypothetical protein
VLLFGGVAAAFGVDCGVFIVARRGWPAARRGAAHAAGALAALAFAAIGFVWIAIPAPWVVPGLAMVVCNAYIAFHLDNMGETARRIRILRELCEAPRGLSREAILAAYPPQEVFDRRIRRLELAGQCIEEDGRLKAQGEAYSLMGSMVALGRRVVFGRPRRAGGEHNL